MEYKLNITKKSVSIVIVMFSFTLIPLAICRFKDFQQCARPEGSLHTKFQDGGSKWPHDNEFQTSLSRKLAISEPLFCK